MRCNIGYKQPEKIPRWAMFWYVVYYHRSEFQIFRSLNGLHCSVLSLYPNSVQNRAWLCLHFSNHSKPNKLTSFSHVLYPCHSLTFTYFCKTRNVSNILWWWWEASPQKLTNPWFFPFGHSKSKKLYKFNCLETRLKLLCRCQFLAPQH